MTTRRIVAVLTIAVMGTLQLWASRVFTAGGLVVGVAVVALLLPIGALLFAERMDVRFASVVACAALLLSAKALAPHPLPAVGVIAVIAAAANWLALGKPAA